MSITIMGHDQNGKPVEIRVTPRGTLDLSSGDIVPVTPADDGAALALTRSIYVGTGGHMKVLTEKGQTVTYKNLPGGSMVPCRVTRVFGAPDTTVADLLAHY